MILTMILEQAWRLSFHFAQSQPVAYSAGRVIGIVRNSSDTEKMPKQRLRTAPQPIIDRLQKGYASRF